MHSSIYFRARSFYYSFTSVLRLHTMSTFVSGVGDEVVLFAAFLGLSVAFIGLISLYKRGRERTGQQEGDKNILKHYML